MNNEMRTIGRKIYFLKQTGDVILDTGQRKGNVSPTTIEEDIQIYSQLKINRNLFDCIQLDYGHASQEFMSASGYKVNPETRKIEFYYSEEE